MRQRRRRRIAARRHADAQLQTALVHLSNALAEPVSPPSTEALRQAMHDHYPSESSESDEERLGNRKSGSL
jgi:hypothetical protein